MNQLYLYVALVGVAFVLYGLTRPQKASPPQLTSVQVPTAKLPGGMDHQEWKDILDEFMNELERDNGRLIDSFTDLQISTNKQLSEQQLRVQALEQRVQDLEAQIEDIDLSAPPVEAASYSPATEAIPQPEPVEETPAAPAPFAFPDKYAGVIERSRLGMSPEEIARETGIGIGEVQLVIGLAKREET